LLVLTETRQRAAELQQRLLARVNDDAAAFRAFLDARRGASGRQASGARSAQIPLDIGRACCESAQHVGSFELHVSGSMRLDVATARNLAHSAARSPLTLPRHNLSLVLDPNEKRQIAYAVEGLRSRDA
jgi:hypothetical protein